MKSCRFIISPNIRYKVGKHGSAKTHSTRFKQKRFVFSIIHTWLKQTSILQRLIGKIVGRLHRSCIFFFQTMHRNNFRTRRKNNAGYYGTRIIWVVWIAYKMRTLLLIDILFLSANIFHVGLSFGKYTFIGMNIKSTETVPYPYSYDTGLVRDSTVARNNYLRYLGYDRFQQHICNPFKWNNLLVLTYSFNDSLIDSRTHNFMYIISPCITVDANEIVTVQIDATLHES